MAHRNQNRTAPSRPPRTGQPHGAACICHRCAPGVAARLAATYVAQRGSYNGQPVPAPVPALRAHAKAYHAHRVPAGGRARYPA